MIPTVIKVRRDLRNRGFEEVGEGGGKLWEICRGWRYDHVITAVEIDPNGKSVWVKIEPGRAEKQ